MVMVVVVVVVVGFNLLQLWSIGSDYWQRNGNQRRRSLLKTLVAFPVAAAAVEYGVSRQYIEGVRALTLPQFSATLLSRLLISFSSSFHHQAKLILYFVSRKRKNAECKHRDQTGSGH